MVDGVVGNSFISCRQPFRNRMYPQKLSHLFKNQYDTRWHRIISVWDESKSKLVNTKVTTINRQGFEPVFCVLLNNGWKLSATANQKVLTKDGFIPLIELKIGDQVACGRKKQIWWSTAMSVEPDGFDFVYQIQCEYGKILINGVITSE